MHDPNPHWTLADGVPGCQVAVKNLAGFRPSPWVAPWSGAWSDG